MSSTLDTMTGLLPCVVCGQTVVVVWDIHPCHGTKYILHVEGVCPTTGNYHRPNQGIEL